MNNNFENAPIHPAIGIIVKWMACLLSGFLACQVAAAQEVDQSDVRTNSSLTVEKNDNGLRVLDQGLPVLQYQAVPKSMNGTHRRANYIHPLYDLAGNVVTQDFPDDHLHHRGIFWAWHRVWVGEKLAGDGWLTQDFDWIVDSVAGEAQPDVATIKCQVRWQSPRIVDAQGEPMTIANETTVISVHRVERGRRAIDFEIKLTAALPDVRIAGSDDAKAYGGFSARIIQPDDIEFRSPQGVVTAAKTQMELGNWVDIVGSIGTDGDRTGIAIMVHPSTAGFPQKWILRSTTRSMQNPVYPGRDPVSISQTQPTILRYRLILHRDQLDASLLEELYQDFALESDANK